MKPRNLSKFIDLDLLLVLALCLLTLWPLLNKAGLPNGTDTLYHIYRVAEMDRSWSHGLLIPQWAESFYFGYGSPLFHYYAGLTYYLTSLVIRIFSVDPVNALRIFITLCMLGAGGGMYLFMRDRVSKLAGILAAVCYVYTPYIVYKEPYARGDLPELLAFALFPLILWRFERFWQSERWRDLALAAMFAGLMVITHNLMALVFTTLLVAWITWNAVTRMITLRQFVLAGVAVALGVGLTAYFWLPALVETSAVQFANLITLAELDYRNFFVPFSQLSAPIPRLDGGAINGLLPLLNIGQAQIILALVGLIGSLVIYQAQRTARLLRTMIFFALMVGGLMFLVTPGSALVWRLVRPLAFLQFPWRFLGPIAFGLAVLTGMNSVWLVMLPARLKQVVIAGAVVLPIVLAMPLFYVPEWTNTAVDTSVSGYHRAETSGLQMATTYSSEYLPVGVFTVPSPTARLLDDYADGYPIDKAHREILPEGVTVEPLEHTPQRDVWRVEADEPFTLEVLTFAFAGWQAEIDGVDVPIRASDPHGLITFDVPAGEHTVRVFLGQTPIRNVGVVATVVALGITITLILVDFRRRGFQTFPDNLPTEVNFRSGVILGGVVALVLLIALMREGVMWVQSPPGEALVAQNQVKYNLSDTVHLVGYDLNNREFAPGDRVELAVYWYAPNPPIEYGYASFVHISTGGPPLAQADKLNPAGRPTKEWTTDGYLYDPYVITLPETMPAGEYQIIVGLYTCETLPAGECGNGDRLEVVDGSDAVSLATIRVR